MNFHRAKLHHTAALATVEYYRVLMLWAKHKSLTNESRVLEQRVVAERLMREALHVVPKQA